MPMKRNEKMYGLSDFFGFSVSLVVFPDPEALDKTSPLRVPNVNGSLVLPSGILRVPVGVGELLSEVGVGVFVGVGVAVGVLVGPGACVGDGVGVGVYVGVGVSVGVGSGSLIATVKAFDDQSAVNEEP